MSLPEFKTIVQFTDGDTTITVDRLGGNKHQVVYTSDGFDFKHIECETLADAFVEVYRFAAEDYVIADEGCKVELKVLYKV